MKRIILAMSLGACLAALPSTAQETPTETAARQEMEEKLKTLTSRIENAEESLAAFKKRMDLMDERLGKLREEIAKLAGDTSVNDATRRSLERLAESIKEVDRARLADQEAFKQAFAELKKGVLEKPTVLPPRTPNSNTATPPMTNSGRTPNAGAGGDVKGWDYSIVSGDNPVVIAKKLRGQNINITSSQIIAANPNVKDWGRLRVGQKIFIPDLSKP